MSRKYYKYPERKKKLNTRSIFILIIFCIISFIASKLNIKYPNGVFEFIKNPLNIIAVFSLFKSPTLIKSNEYQFDNDISEQIRKFKEVERINDEIRKYSKL